MDIGANSTRIEVSDVVTSRILSRVLEAFEKEIKGVNGGVGQPTEGFWSPYYDAVREELLASLRGLEISRFGELAEKRLKARVSDRYGYEHENQSAGV